MTHTEARELANQFGSRMCDENGDTHNQELYCFDLDDIIALKEALAQPEQEPVAHCKVRPLRGDESFPKVEIDWVNQPIPGPLYTSPPQRKPLTDEQRKDLMNKAWNKWLGGKDDNHLFAWHFSVEVEAAHGIKENK